MELDEYWQMMRSRICHRCIDGDAAGVCHLPGGENSCTIKHFLPEIVMTVANTHAEDIEVYVGALRRNVCTLCDWQNEDLTCNKRDDLECALDRYYPLVLQVIEAVRTQIHALPPQT